MTATELATKIMNGELTSAEVTEAHIKRIEEVNGSLNAVVVKMFDQARAQAKKADEALKNGQKTGPLHGVPITIKEQFRVAGTATTLGIPSQKDWRASSDGPLVARLRAAGAVILGKTNVSQMLAYDESDNPLYGKTLNPWSPKRSSGGSSGGEGAIVAAHGSAMGLGGDFGGSVRIPAHVNGINALKPTSGRLTNLDNRFDLLGDGPSPIVPQQGILARSVADVALGMRVLATNGKREKDEVAPSSWPDENSVQLKGMRVGYYVDDGYFAASPGLRRAVLEAVEALKAQGVTVEPFNQLDAETAVRLFLSIAVRNAVAPYKKALKGNPVDPRIGLLIKAGGLPSFLRNILAKRMRKKGEVHLSKMIGWAKGKRSEQEYNAILRELEAYREDSLKKVEKAKLDALLCPPNALPALTHGASEDLFPSMSYSIMYNVLGWPAGVVAATMVRPGEESDRPPSKDPAYITAARVENGSAGLPLGVQVVGRPWREDVVLKVMEALEGHFSEKPDYPLSQNPV
jgi:fatty acid amide hydrolase